MSSEPEGTRPGRSAGGNPDATSPDPGSPGSTAELLRPDPERLPHPPLVDVHVHLAADGGPGLPAQDWPALAAAAGVRVAAVFPPLRPHGYAAANAALLQAATTHGSGWRPFARLGGPVPFPAPERWPALWQVRRALRSRIGDQPAHLRGGPAELGRYAGVKLLPHLDGFPGPEWLTAIAELGLPVLVHTGEHVPPALVEHRLLRVLRGPVVLGHLGSFPASAPHLLAALDLVRRYDQVYLETSASWLAEFVALAARRVPDKLMFGSDAPLMHPEVAWRHVATAVRDDEHCALIAHRTAEEVLGW